MEVGFDYQIVRAQYYHLLLRKITDLWRPKADFDLVAMENGYFSVKFSSMDDYEYVKYGGPWLLFNHYLHIQP